MHKKNDIQKLIASLGICYLAGAIGSLYTVSSVTTWYQTLVRPTFTPPDWLFGVVWPILYTLMGISLFIVWSNTHWRKNTTRTILLFDIHLVVNALWSYMFFGLHNPLYGLITIGVLLVLVFTLIIRFKHFSRTAAWLLVPYFLWCCFAAVLNASIWYLN